MEYNNYFGLSPDFETNQHDDYHLPKDMRFFLVSYNFRKNFLLLNSLP